MKLNCEVAVSVGDTSGCAKFTLSLFLSLFV